MFIKWTSLILISLSLFIAFPLFAQESREKKDAYLSFMALRLHEKINEARENPLGVAESFGIASEQLLNELPELYDILTKGLPALYSDKHLYQAAHAHTEEMLTHNYYAHNSPDHRTYEDRMMEKGYMPAVAGESLGILKFSNFIDPDIAVNLIFENMFRDQLDPASTTERNILNPNVKEIGIALETGKLSIDEVVHNVYIVTCDFASPVEKVEVEFFQLINLARFSPIEMAFLLEVDLNYMITYYPELYANFPKKLPPLTFSSRLYASAKTYATDIFDNGYSYHDTEDDDLTVMDRILQSGYEPLLTEEAVEYSFCVDRGYFQLFENLVTDELFHMPEYADHRVFDPDLRDVGIGFVTGESDKLTGLCSKSVNLMVADFGTPVVPKKPGIMGIAYLDQDHDGFYTQGEGIHDLSISVESLSGFYRNIHTNEAGGFAVLSLDPDEYRLKAQFDSYEMIEDVTIGEENEFVIFKERFDVEEVIEKEELTSASF